MGYVENREIATAPHVYSARSLIPARFSDIKVPVLNAGKDKRILPKGTELGILQEIDSVEDAEIPEEDRVDEEEVSESYKEVIRKMMSNLPEELSLEHRTQVEQLLIRHRTILSTGEHDILRTHLVEHHIDTGDCRPIRQPLHRHLFQHVEYMKEETDRMLEHGIIEPAASPWASNVVLVKKKDGALCFCIDYRS